MDAYFRICRIFAARPRVADSANVLYLIKIDGTVLVFVDEIQNSSIAIKTLRYFYEELPGIYVIATGSLLETMLNRQISFPVGRVEYMALRPCTSGEFLGAVGEAPLGEYVESAAVPEVLHSRLHNVPYYAGSLEKIVEKGHA